MTRHSATELAVLRIPAIDARDLTPEGFLITTVRMARDGELDWGDHVKRRSLDALQSALPSISSHKVAVTQNHPKDMLDSGNAAGAVIGWLHGDANIVEGDDGHNYIEGGLTIVDQDAIEGVFSGEAAEVSIGYTYAQGMDDDGTITQDYIEINHLAVLAQGRSGQGARVNVDSDSMSDENQVELPASAPLFSDEQLTQLRALISESVPAPSPEPVPDVAVAADAAVDRVEALFSVRDILGADAMRDLSGEDVQTLRGAVIVNVLPDADCSDEAAIPALYQLACKKHAKDRSAASIVKSAVDSTFEKLGAMYGGSK